MPACDSLEPGIAGAAPVANRGDGPERAAIRRERRGSPGRSSEQQPAAAPRPQAAGPACTVTTTPTQKARRTCTTRRQVTYRPVTVTVRRVRLHQRRVRVRQVRYRQEVRMVPVQRQVPNGNGKHNDKGKKKNGKARQDGGTHTETVYVRQVRRVPVVRYVTRVRQQRQVRYVKVTKRQRIVRTIRHCG